MSNCYVITGAMGSGKTLLLRELVALGYAGVPEAAREIIAEQRAIDGDGLYDRNPARFVQLMLERCVDDLASANTDDEPIFFDRGIPDVVAHHELATVDPAPAWDAARRHRYSDVVFALRGWPEVYTTDEDRIMSFEAADAFGERVIAIYEELRYTVVDVPKSSPDERARFILDRLALR